MFCAKWASGETDTLGVPALRALHFQVHNLSVLKICQSYPRSDALNTASLEVLRQEYSTLEQFRLTQRTHQQCIHFCDYNEVEAMYRLKSSLHFTPQTTSFNV